MIKFLIAQRVIYSYSLIVENSTGTDLKLSYKGESNQETVENTIIIPNGESLMIIEDEEVFPGGGCPGTSCEHCTFFVENLEAFIQDSIPSTIGTCDCNKISFTETEKRSGEFKIKYTLDDF